MIRLANNYERLLSGEVKKMKGYYIEEITKLLPLCNDLFVFEVILKLLSKRL